MRTYLFSFMRREHLVPFILAVSVLLIASVTLADIIVGLSTTNSSTNVTITNLTLTKPSDVAQGDLMLANVAIHDGSNVAVTPPSGWTQILRTDEDTDIGIASYWKIAGASEPANYTWSLSPQTRAEGGITRYTGVDSSNPIDAAAGNVGHGHTATTSPITTTASSEEIALYAIHDGASTNAGNFFSTPTGMTKEYDSSYTAAGPSIAAADAIQATAGVAGSKSSTIAGTRQHDWAAQVIALRAPSHHISVEAGTNGSTSFVGHAQNQVTFSKSVSATSTLLIVHIMSSVVTGVTYAGVPINFATTSAYPGQSVSIWYLVNPQSGSNNVVANFSVVADSLGSAVSYTGTDTSNPFGTISISNGTIAQSDIPSVNITTIHDNSVIDDSLGYNFGQPVTANPPQVQQAAVLVGNNVSHGASTLQTTTHGVYTLGWTHGGPADNTWAEVAVEINAAP